MLGEFDPVCVFVSPPSFSFSLSYLSLSYHALGTNGALCMRCVLTGITAVSCSYLLSFRFCTSHTTSFAFLLLVSLVCWLPPFCGTPTYTPTYSLPTVVISCSAHLPLSRLLTAPCSCFTHRALYSHTLYSLSSCSVHIHGLAPLPSLFTGPYVRLRSLAHLHACIHARTVVCCAAALLRSCCFPALSLLHAGQLFFTVCLSHVSLVALLFSCCLTLSALPLTTTATFIYLGLLFLCTFCVLSRCCCLLMCFLRTHCRFVTRVSLTSCSSLAPVVTFFSFSRLCFPIHFSLPCPFTLLLLALFLHARFVALFRGPLAVSSTLELTSTRPVWPTHSRSLAHSLADSTISHCSHSAFVLLLLAQLAVLSLARSLSL